MTSTNGYSVLINTMWISQVIAQSKTGMTVGEVNKVVNSLTRGQVKRIMDGMVKDGYMSTRKEPHGKTGKVVYRISEGFVMECCQVAQNYNQAIS